MLNNVIFRAYVIMKFSEKNIKIVVNVLRWFYLVFIILTSLTTLAFILLLLNGPPKNESHYYSFITGILLLLTCTAIYFGLKNRRQWIVPVMVILSSLNIVLLIFSFPKDLLHVIATIIGMCIAGSELYFFTKKEVRKYFNTKGFYLFG